MIRFLKYAALTAGTLLLLLLAVAALVRAGVDPNDYKGDIIRLAQQKHQRTLAIPDTIKLTLYPRIGANLGRLVLSEQGGNTQFAAVDNARISVALLPLVLRREVVIDRIDIRGMRAAVIRRADGSVNIGDLTSPSYSGPATAPPEHGHAPLRVAIDSIRIDDAHIDFDDRRTGRTVVISHLHIDSGQIRRGVTSRLAASANIRSSRPAINTALTLRGKFTPDLERRRVTFTELEANLDLSPPQARASINGSIDMDLDKDEFEAELTGRLDDSSFDLSAGLREQEWRLSAHIDTLDLNRYWIPGPVIDLTSLSALRARGGIEIGSLTAGPIRATAVRAALRAGAGKLVLQPIAASAYGGVAKGSLAFDFSASASTPRITLLQELKAVQVGPLLTDLGGKAPVDGKGDVLVDVHTEGSSAVQLREALSGSTVMRLTDGTINGIDLAGLLKGAPSDQGVAGTGGVTRFTSLNASFTIANGVAHNADLAAHAPALAMAGAGDIDLARRQIDYTLACTLAGTHAALPVHVAGPWDAISWHIDTKAVSGAEVKQQARDKLKKTIRGLLKR